MRTIDPRILYELGELKEHLGGAYDPLAKGTKLAKTDEAVTCPHINHHGETWVRGQDVIDWLGRTGQFRAPQETKRAGTRLLYGDERDQRQVPTEIRDRNRDVVEADPRETAVAKAIREAAIAANLEKLRKAAAEKDKDAADAKPGFDAPPAGPPVTNTGDVPDAPPPPVKGKKGADPGP